MIFGDQCSSKAASFSAKSTTLSGAATVPPAPRQGPPLQVSRACLLYNVVGSAPLLPARHGRTGALDPDRLAAQPVPQRLEGGDLIGHADHPPAAAPIVLPQQLLQLPRVPLWTGMCSPSGQ